MSYYSYPPNSILKWNTKRDFITNTLYEKQIYIDDKIVYMPARCMAHLIQTPIPELDFLPNKKIQRVYRNTKDGEYFVIYEGGLVQAIGGWTPDLGYIYRMRK